MASPSSSSPKKSYVIDIYALRDALEGRNNAHRSIVMKLILEGRIFVCSETKSTCKDLYEEIYQQLDDLNCPVIKTTGPIRIRAGRLTEKHSDISYMPPRDHGSRYLLLAKAIGKSVTVVSSETGKSGTLPHLCGKAGVACLSLGDLVDAEEPG